MIPPILAHAVAAVPPLAVVGDKAIVCVPLAAVRSWVKHLVAAPTAGRLTGRDDNVIQELGYLDSLVLLVVVPVRIYTPIGEPGVQVFGENVFDFFRELGLDSAGAVDGEVDVGGIFSGLGDLLTGGVEALGDYADVLREAFNTGVDLVREAGDTDGDGLTNYRDGDDDGDGTPDVTDDADLDPKVGDVVPGDADEDKSVLPTEDPQEDDNEEPESESDESEGIMWGKEFFESLKTDALGIYGSWDWPRDTDEDGDGLPTWEILAPSIVSVAPVLYVLSSVMDDHRLKFASASVSPPSFARLRINFWV